MQQQAVVVFSSHENTSKLQDLRVIPPAINHIFVVFRARRNKWEEHLKKERQKRDKLLRYALIVFPYLVNINSSVSN